MPRVLCKYCGYVLYTTTDSYLYFYRHVRYLPSKCPKCGRELNPVFDIRITA
jgi:phage FluMu protein Com